MDHPRFLDVVSNAWNKHVVAASSAARMVAKFKNLIYDLKKSKSISNLKSLIKNCNEVILVLDKLRGTKNSVSPGKQYEDPYKNI